MTTLSIIVPSLGTHAQLEQTLLSILETRPPKAEILVVDGTRYPDPYQLDGEVRFLPAPNDSSPTRCLQTGFNAARGDVVHWLAAGAEATPGWTDEAVWRLTNDAHAAVLPYRRKREGGATPWGLATSDSGAVREVSAVAEKLTPGATEPAAGWRWGCRLEAGFVRRGLLAEYGPLAPSLGEYALLDFSCWASDRGKTTLHIPQAEFILSEAPAPTWRDVYAQAGSSERLFWRNLSEHRWGVPTAAHLFQTLCEAFDLRGGRGLARLLGRSGVWFEVSRHRRRRAESRPAKPAHRPASPVSAPHWSADRTLPGALPHS